MKYLLYVTALMSIASSAVFAQPKIQIVGGETHDWGKVKAKDSPLKAIVKLKNVLITKLTHFLIIKLFMLLHAPCTSQKPFQF